MSGDTLFIVMVDVDPPSAESAFNAWYNEEHVPELLRVPGFLTGQRFRAIKGAPKYIAAYELSSFNALSEPLFLKARPAHPDSTPATKRMWQHVRNLRRGIYTCFASAQIARDAEPLKARFMLLVGLNIDPVANELFQQWFVRKHLAELAGMQHIVRARGYALDARSADHKDAPGRCMLLYELARMDAGQDTAWLRAPGTEWAEQLTKPSAANPRNLYERIYPT